MFQEGEKRILIDHDALDEHYVPRRLTGREPQLNQLEFCLAPALKGNKPQHCLLHGDPGTGKTATTKFLLKKLEHEWGVRGVYVNCWEYNSFYAVTDRIIAELRMLGAEKFSTRFKLERLEQFLGGKPFIIVLDEIDQPCPRERDSMLYSLSSLGKIGLIAVCKNKNTLFGLDDRVRSRLQPTTIQFSPYSPNDFVSILATRAERALVPGAWNTTTLRKIASLSGGDARVAIRTLKNAAYHAESDRESRIVAEHVVKGWNSAKNFKRSFLLNKLTEHHRLLYEITRKQKQILSGTLWSLYLRECNKKKIKPMAVRTYSLYTNKLIELGLIKAERALVKGKVRLLKVA